MGWFDRQVREIKKNDQEAFEDSIFHMASVVLGDRDSEEAADDRILTKAAVDDILKFYHYKPVDIPASVKDPDEQLEFALRPRGIMRRRVDLKDEWWRDSFGPILAYRKEDGHPAALLPLPYTGYYYNDKASGKRVAINRKTASQFDLAGYCFYRPLTQKKLGIRDLLVYLKGCISNIDILVFVLLTLAVTLVGMITPGVTRALTGPVLESGNVPLLFGTAVFMVSAAVSAMLISSARNLCLGRVQTKTSLSVEAALMSRIMNLPASFFRKYSSGELASRYNNASQLCSQLLGVVFSGGISSLISLLYVTQIFTFAPALGLPALITITATIVIGAAASFMQMRISREAMETGAKTNGISYAIITGIQKIKLAGAEKRAFARWANSYAEAAKYRYDTPLFLRANQAIILAVSLAGTIVLYFLAVKTGVSPSEYLAFSAAYGSVSAAFSSLAGTVLSAADIKPILDMAEPILKTEPESSEDRAMVTQLSGGIELNNVYFRYKESMPYVINGMDLKIKQGEYLAIVGTTGCGKSTLIRLLLGFETPEKGAIYYDGKDMSHLDLKSLRRKIGVVTQDGSLFQGDIYSNIVISAPQLTMDDAWKAAELAGIADDIREMPMGMNTVLSEGQGGISGGQKQRIMIARAIAPKPKILMFDEATSALDNKTQKQVAEALDGLKCTRIVIAHRLSTIKHCDRIIVLDKGNIVEEGSYDELVAHNGFFAELVERQRLDIKK